MSEEAIPQATVVPPTAESLPTRPDMEEAEIKGAAADKVPGREGSAGENAKGGATGGNTATASQAVDSTIAPPPTNLFHCSLY
jgi:hypothetical protein